MEIPPKAVVLLSGGLDSTTTLAIALAEGFTPHVLTFRSGQRHEAEVEAARRVARRFGVARHVVVSIDLRLFGGSALTAEIRRRALLPFLRWVTHEGQRHAEEAYLVRLPPGLVERLDKQLERLQGGN